jgi:signal transduction histidine kinase
MTEPHARSSLQTRLMLAMGAFVLALVALYTVYALAFAYTVEDQFIARALAAEAARVEDARARDGRWPVLDGPHLRLVTRAEDLPAELRSLVIAEPQRREFAGEEGRHYHLHPLDGGGEPAWLVAEVSQQLVFRGMRAVVLEILGYSALAALAAGLLVAWWVARSTTRPLRALAAAVQRLDADRLPAVLPALHVGASDAEVATLMRGLDDLLRRIGGYIAREQAFTRDASHELRTPLTVILSQVEVLAANPALPPALRPALDQIEAAARGQADTLDALLELARAEPGPAAPQPLLPAIERAIVMQAARRVREDLEFSIDIPPGTSTAIRPAVLRIVLANLIGNVYAHADPGPVRIEVREDRWRIRNRAAHGLGAGTQRGSAGLGIGLTIVRRLDEQHGLDLRIEAIGGDVEASFALHPAGPAPSP